MPSRRSAQGQSRRPVEAAHRPAQARSSPEQQAAFLAALVTSADIAIIGKTLDGMITSWNAASERLYGYTAAEMVGQPITTIAPPERWGEISDALATLRRGERVPAFETVRVRKDGVRIDVLVSISPVIDERGAVLGAATIARDITAARRHEAQLQALADLSGEVAEAGLDVDAVLHRVALRVATALGDGVVLRLLGEDGLELAATRHRNPDAQPVLLRAAARVIPVGRGVQGRVAATNEAILIPSQPWVDPRLATAPADLDYEALVGLVSLLVVPARASGRVIGTLMVLRDRGGCAYAPADQAFLQAVADRTAAAIESARLFAGEWQARAAAEQAVRLRDEVLHSISHDLRNPLTAIRSQAQLLDRTEARAGTPADSPLRRGLERIADGARRASEQLEELVDASRLQIGGQLILQREPIDLAELAARAVEAWRVAAPDHVIELDVAEAEVVGTWDRRRLARVVDNLLANAVRYSPPGSQVQVRLRREPTLPPEAERGAQAMAVLEVQDQGIGIPSADLPHIFEWFRRGSNVEHIAGTGIGLAGAKAIVAQHGGTVGVESEEGHGSTFILRLPVEPPDATA